MSSMLVVYFCAFLALVGANGNTTENNATFVGINGVPLMKEGHADILIRLHGSFMVLAWGAVAPVGLMLSLFYKVVWPGGEWFYAHIALMMTTLVVSLIGIIPIVVHANGIWLTTTALNLPHQILGITALTSVALNPFLAICRCYPGSKWRWIYNAIHGGIGIMLGQAAACGAMLLGLHIMRELDSADYDYVHYAIYSVSGLVGLIVMVPALFNIYVINYKKGHATKEDLGVTSEPPTEFENVTRINDEDDEDDEEEESSHDYGCRVVVGVFLIIFLLIGTLTTIIMLALI